MIKIIVGVATYNRNELLEKCLDSLAGISIPPDAEVAICVADNSPLGMAREVVGRFSECSAVVVRYIHASERGISQARNAIVDVANEELADFIAFIDDDEVVESEWLRALLLAVDKFHADAVQGPIFPLFDSDCMSQSDDVVRTVTREEGVELTSVGTGNVLFSTKLVREQGLRFDPIFSFTGGGDYDFFLRSSILGNRHVWTNDAVVREITPALRVSQSYKIRRSFRKRAAVALSDKLRLGGGAALKHFALAVRDLLSGAFQFLLLPFSILGGVKVFKKYLIRSVSNFAKGAGRLSGLLGWNIKMYK